MTTTITGCAPPRWNGSSAVTQVVVLTGRSLRAFLTDPGLVLVGLIQPVMTLFVFTQIFGNLPLAGGLPPGTEYLDFLMPAVLVNHVVQTSSQTGVGLVEDLRNGIVARLRSLPIMPSSLLLARSTSDFVRTAVQLVMILALAVGLLGYAPRGGFVGMVLSALLTLAVGSALSWAFLAMGACMRRTEPMQNISVLVMVPLMFISSAFVPIEQLPDWLEVVARLNPLTYAVDASRAVALDLADGGQLVVPSLLISVLVTLASAAIAVRGFRRPL
ncbi:MULTISPECIES: ABC transporter permease [Saccharopolyspora]|uniref:Transport permease protein n=1 Tax=Saccharopolyspora gregorii TaxID=33914 RepID=A0ABP6RLI2_9PSEU|nr:MULTISPECIES: ABC transporter permease [unclassified Saccharopolyspora]MCA1229771.1 ABC transporter permease [Saccharopolyspora sp. 6M]MCA1281555.1 ABC transporter permease [Saccharopolyspora sp. 7B]